MQAASSTSIATSMAWGALDRPQRPRRGRLTHRRSGLQPLRGRSPRLRELHPARPGWPAAGRQGHAASGRDQHRHQPRTLRTTHLRPRSVAVVGGGAPHQGPLQGRGPLHRRRQPGRQRQARVQPDHADGRRHPCAERSHQSLRQPRHRLRDPYALGEIAYQTPQSGFNFGLQPCAASRPRSASRPS